jgi:hypothetical protein
MITTVDWNGSVAFGVGAGCQSKSEGEIEKECEGERCGLCGKHVYVMGGKKERSDGLKGGLRMTVTITMFTVDYADGRWGCKRIVENDVDELCFVQNKQVRGDLLGLLGERLALSLKQRCYLLC